jgi:ABC-type glycerol-3-phosphate transport system substrate-binding protein
MDPALASGATLDGLWSSGQTAMMINGGWNVGAMDVNFPQWKGKWEVAPLPAGRRDVGFYGGQHLMIARASKHPQLAWEFMVFATSPATQLQWSDITGSPPSNLRVFAMPAFRRRHAHFVRMREAMLRGRNNPRAPFFNKIWYGRFQSRVLDVVMKDPRADIAAALRAAAREMQALADDYWSVRRHSVERVGEDSHR